MQFRFIGDPNNGGNGPEISVHYGYRFAKGKPCEVDIETAKKLATNDHFEPVDKDTDKPIEDMNKVELEAYALERYGLELDRRFSRDNLIDQVLAHGDEDGHPQQGA